MERALLFSGLLYSDSDVYERVKPILLKKFGTPFLVSDETDWNHTEYYRDELGRGILRRFIIFNNIIEREKLPDIKITTNRIESDFSVNNRRTINIDPGYITLSKIVLATTKDFSHRIYLRDGIYGEVTLSFEKGTYRPQRFTYPDYREERTIEILTKGREYLKSQ